MSKKLHSLQEAESFLLSYSPEKPTGATYTLSRMKLLMERLGNPQNDIRCVHVAGTSGKTSTSYYVRALLEAHGQKTGLTSSPHVVSITERVQIGGRPLAASDFLDYLNDFLSIIEPWSDIEPSYFELLVAFAFWVFKREQVDYMVVEVGLGGLLDATNVITRHDKICVITPIGLDHTTVLGNTIESIAAQKAGIIMPASVVFSARQESVVGDVLAAVGHETNSQIQVVDTLEDRSSDVPLFQQANFALARKVVDHLVERDELVKMSEKDTSRCIAESPPGRFEVYRIGDRTLILDGAHNPQKLSAFVTSLRMKHPEPMSWLLGFVEAPDSKIESCLREVFNVADDYVFTQFNVAQDIKGRVSVNVDTLTRYSKANQADTAAESDAFKALERILASKKRTVVVSGSLYLVALLRPRIIELAT